MNLDSMYEISNKNVAIDDLFRCIREGLELKYESWLVWQTVARGAIAVNLPDRMKEIDDVDSCIDIYWKRLDRFRSMTTRDVFSSAYNTIKNFYSLCS